MGDAFAVTAANGAASELRALADAVGRISGADMEAWAVRHGMRLLEAQIAACAAGCMPLRYARNAATLTPSDQERLLRSHVLLVGLGGLGGHVLDMLVRMGIGHITGVDGDVFEETNANRQLLVTQETLGGGKAHAAARYVALVNPAVCFTPVASFVNRGGFAPLMSEVDVVVDALGGLDHRAALHATATEVGRTVVSAGLAGLTGWVAVVRPGEAGPMPFLERGGTSVPSVEESLGNLAPTVGLAASLQGAEVLKILTGRPPAQGILFFDLLDHYFTSVLL